MLIFMSHCPTTHIIFKIVFVTNGMWYQDAVILGQLDPLSPYQGASYLGHIYHRHTYYGAWSHGEI